ncbi:D-alanyl-D-alanine carboxypeptidase family protein [Patescibacteria group bacterium]|nr:D-alanyl-D-alanine carboxypeptidase family protein [Patescibacteria group bacterium]MBU1015577.1 D-alanyl-D-alanine carboxypeptidase family protein [Patescibacteria group bacterium]MBU1684731.1 D-alanyl-D-alanine carboxypeptidase family protein [Patescibacteria group bacterium]MBU1938280.1 D-alanyl-D-alanine carboxypeptidase family protein [Patescibacteria group bacterium]
MADDFKGKKFPWAYYALATMFVVMVGGNLVSGSFAGCVSPDNRTAEEMTRDYGNYRHRQNKAWGIDNVPHFADLATCQMKKMGFWDANGRTVEKTVYLPAKAGTNPEVDSKYLWYGNLNNHSLAWRRTLVIEKFGQLRLHKNFKDTVKWFSEGFEAFKKDHPSVSEKEVFEQYVDYFLSLPLVCPRWVNGNCMKTWDGSTSKEDADKGRDCLLNQMLAEQVTKANRELHDEKKVEIQPVVCFRSNLHQSVIFVTNNGGKCSLEDSGSNFRMPGNSHHELGLAMDLANFKEAEPYLADVGIACGFVPDDAGHCSTAEENIDRILAGWSRRIGGWGRKGKDIYKFFFGK